MSDGLSLYDHEQGLILAAKDAADNPNDPQALEVFALYLQGTEEKREKVGRYLLDVDASIDKMHQERDRMDARIAEAEAHRDKLHERVAATLRAAGRKEAKGITVTLKAYDNPPKLDIPDEAIVPAEYKQVVVNPATEKTVLMRDAIWFSIKAGKQVPGVTVTQGFRLKVK